MANTRHVVLSDFETKRSRMTYQVKSGMRVHKANGEWFVDPSEYPRNTFSRHDATYYGFRVDPANVVKITD